MAVFSHFPYRYSWEKCYGNPDIPRLRQPIEQVKRIVSVDSLRFPGIVLGQLAIDPVAQRVPKFGLLEFSIQSISAFPNSIRTSSLPRLMHGSDMGRRRVNRQPMRMRRRGTAGLQRARRQSGLAERNFLPRRDIRLDNVVTPMTSVTLLKPTREPIVQRYKDWNDMKLL